MTKLQPIIESYNVNEEYLYNKTYIFIKGYASGRNFVNTLKALPLFRKLHDGQYRNGTVLIDGKEVKTKTTVDEKKVVCQKCISSNEWYLAGHFPGNPVMPGVLMVEGMAQAASIIGKALAIEEEGVLLFASIDECKFSGMATVGDILIVEAIVTKIRGQLVIGECCIKKNDQIIAKCNLKAFRKVL